MRVACRLFGVFGAASGLAAIAQQPANDPRLEQFEKRYEQGDRDAAVAEMRRWCEETPGQPQRWTLATSYLLNQKNDGARATPFAEKALELLPDAPDVSVALGFCYLTSDHPLESERLFRAAEKKFPGNAQVAYGVASACAMNRKLTESQERFVALAEREPDNVLYQFMAGENSMKLHLYELAEGFFRAANDKDKRRHPDAAWKLAQVLGYEHKDDLAERLFKNAMQFAPPQSRSQAAFQYAVFLQERKRASEAIPLLEEVLTTNADHRMAWNYLSRCRLAQGDVEGARVAQAKFRELQQRLYHEEEEYLLGLIRAQLSTAGETDGKRKEGDRP